MSVSSIESYLIYLGSFEVEEIERFRQMRGQAAVVANYYLKITENRSIGKLGCFNNAVKFCSETVREERSSERFVKIYLPKILKLMEEGRTVPSLSRLVSPHPPKKLGGSQTTDYALLLYIAKAGGCANFEDGLKEISRYKPGEGFVNLYRRSDAALSENIERVARYLHKIVQNSTTRPGIGTVTCFYCGALLTGNRKSCNNPKCAAYNL